MLARTCVTGGCWFLLLCACKCRVSECIIELRLQDHEPVAYLVQLACDPDVQSLAAPVRHHRPIPTVHVACWCNGYVLHAFILTVQGARAF